MLLIWSHLVGMIRPLVDDFVNIFYVAFALSLIDGTQKIAWHDLHVEPTQLIGWDVNLVLGGLGFPEMTLRDGFRTGINLVLDTRIMHGAL